jgi:hypothetical protein
LLVDLEVPYADERLWRYWLKEDRAKLPEASARPRSLRPASDGSELGLPSRIVELALTKEIPQNGGIGADQEVTARARAGVPSVSPSVGAVQMVP